MQVHLVDGTFELFRYYYAPGGGVNGPASAAAGVLGSMLGLIEGGATHVGVATDQVIESFRNELYPAYKTSAGMEPELLAQFPILEEGLAAMGVRVWPMVRYEADDALASAAEKAAADERVTRVLICSPDKDLAQCVQGTRVIQVDRLHRIERDHAGVRAKWGVDPESMPDYLAMVGDSADGFPGLPGWGAKSASAVLGEYGHFEAVPRDWRAWKNAPRGGARLAQVLFERWEDALLFRKLATVVRDVPVFDEVDEMRWRGPRVPEFADFCGRVLRLPGLAARAGALSVTRARE